MLSSLNANMFKQRYSNVSEGPKEWQAINTTDSDIYNWETNSTYVKRLHFLMIYLTNQKVLNQSMMLEFFIVRTSNNGSYFTSR